MHTVMWPVLQNKPRQGNQDPDTKQKAERFWIKNENEMKYLCEIKKAWEP